MATLNQIAYNIKELLSGGDEREEQKISTRQIKHWIHYHRAKIIEEKLLSGSSIDRRWIQPICCKMFEPQNFPDLHSLDAVIDQWEEPNAGANSTMYQHGFSTSSFYGQKYTDNSENDYFVATMREIPITINVNQVDGITDIRLKRKIINAVQPFEDQTRWQGWVKVPVKTKDEAGYQWANKFARNENPFAVIYNNNSNQYHNVEINGLRYSPNLHINKSTPHLINMYSYMMEMYGILQDPTESKSFIVDNMGIQTQDFIDAVSDYPISNEDLPLLISRVAEVEMTLLLRTPEDLVEDNTNTSKINIGQPQQQRR